VLYPLSDRYYSVVGKLVLSTGEGVVQTYVELGADGPAIASPGTTGTHHVGSWVNPTPGTDNPPGAERAVRIVDSGWQAVAVVAAAVALPARRLLGGGGC
jgi:hypothetical protein